MKLKLDNVFIVSNIPVRYSCNSLDLQKYQYLKHLPIRQVRDESQVEILIGMDNAHVMMPLEVCHGPDSKNQPYAVWTLFGWSLNGPAHDRPNVEVMSNFVNVEEQIERIWDMEVLDEDLQSLSYEDKKVIKLWNDEIQWENGHYVLPIPWRKGAPNFPNNRYMATLRLKHLLSRLEKIRMFDAYRDKMNQMISDGYVEPVPEIELGRCNNAVWYLPHHGVTSESKPGKIRIVFDCAAKQNGISLNNQCLQGPDLNNKLIHVLLRFRQYKYAIIADIEAMYLQVKIPTKDRDSLRFLWVENDSIKEYRMTSHLFGGVWCASSSTFALRQTAADPSVSEMIRSTVNKSFYVDDLLKSVKTKEEAQEVIFGTKEILKSGGFNLTKFIVNDVQLQHLIDKDDRAKEMKEITGTLEVHSKALGIRWDVISDSFYYSSKYTNVNEKITKRLMLSQVSSMYDPLGLIAPVTQQGKMIFQKATLTKSSWDDEIPQELSEKWFVWIKSLENVPQFKFPRCIIPHEFTDSVLELHHFCDASEQGYGACSYLRAINQQGKIFVNLLAAKGRLAPVKKITIPRLELSAAVVAVKLDSIARRELEVALLKSYFWTDSQITLAYIQSDSKRFKVFVANRVAQIRERSRPDQWNFIKSDDNPADILSRGKGVEGLISRWLNGPPFLSEYKSSWDIVPCDRLEILVNDPEMKSSFTGDGKKIQERGQVNVNTVLTQGLVHPIEAMTDYYSSFYRLKKAFCWLLRLKECLQKRKRQNLLEIITVQEMKKAQDYIMKYVQSQKYPEEIDALRTNKNLRLSSPIRKLSPVLNNGLLVVGGRLKHAAFSYALKHPIILPSDHRISLMIVEEYHGATHLGTEWTLSQVRNKFWIMNARRFIKEVKHKCVACKRLYGSPTMQRCEPGQPPFTYVGVDLFGPFYVKVGRSEVKRYGCLFTCFNTRAIHIEVLNSLETDTFINGFLRFVSRRGYPKKVWSDNGTNLVGARTELSKSLRQLDRGKVIRTARQSEIEWTFNPPLASHQGGVWERMIRTIRRIMLSLLVPTVRMTDDILHTTFCEVESIVNSRPLTKNSEDIHDEVPLTPNHLLLLRENAPLPWGVFHDTDVYRKHWRQVQHNATKFWRRWTKEYLVELQKRQKWLKETPNFRIGDLVLILDENTDRGSWPMGLVVETSLGRDGLVRSAKIKTKSSVLVKPITKLVFLEGSCYT